MIPAVEYIKTEIRNLAPEEVEALLRDLQNEYVMPAPGEDEDEAAVEAAWDTEIDRRVKEIEEGKVELISGAESERHIDQLFARHGLTRIGRAAV